MPLPAKHERPDDVAAFLSWGRNTEICEIDSVARNHYSTVVLTVKSQIQQSKLWTELLESIERTSQEYYLATSYKLFPSDEAKKPELVTKSVDSVVEKCFRKDILLNQLWPEPPQDGWVNPHNWFTSISDNVRTQFVVKYLDGVETLVECLRDFFQSRGIELSVKYHARDYGYYSVHLVFFIEQEVPGKAFTTETLQFPIEVQIRTELQDVISRLTHSYYETRRMKPETELNDWQWRYDSDEFVPNYLGHILHYVEGMIMEVRKRGG